MTQRALIVGAGIMGLSAAWALRRDGWQVEVIEQDAVPNPRAASVDRHRLIRHAYGARRGYMRMVDDAYAAWAQVWDDIGETLHVPTGVLALGDAANVWLRETRLALEAEGQPFGMLHAGELAQRFAFLGPQADDALYLPAGGVLLADRIVAALAARTTILRGRVTEVYPDRAAVRLGDGGERSADLLVVAAGAWAPRLVPALAGRVTPSRQVVVYVDPPAGLDAAWAAAPMVLDFDGGFYAVPPVAGTGLKLGDHTFSMTGDPDGDREAGEEEAAAILARAAGRLRDPGGYRVAEVRACFYDVAPEESFVVEPLGPACWAMSGFSGHGFKFAACLGLALARAVRDPAHAAALPGWAAGAFAEP